MSIWVIGGHFDIMVFFSGLVLTPPPDIRTKSVDVKLLVEAGGEEDQLLLVRAACKLKESLANTEGFLLLFFG